jgi:predicted nuclease of predicted toxin-antitoxin system
LKLLIDNDLSVNIPQEVEPFFQGSKHVTEVGLDRLTDKQIFHYAGKNDFIILSKDKDFYHLINTYGPPPKIVWLRVGNCNNRLLIETIVKNCPSIIEFIRSSRSLMIIDSIELVEL